MNFLKNRYTKSFLTKITDLSFAITLLFIIGLFVGIGTIIEQDQSIAFYQENYPELKPQLGFVTWRLIRLLGLDHVYSNIYFLSLLSIFTLSIVTCTFTTQLPSLKNFRLWKFLSQHQQFEKQNTIATRPRDKAMSIAFQVYTEKYHVFRQGYQTYSYSGLLGRVGPIIVHFSIMLLLIGTSLGTLGGYNIQQIVPRGEIVHLQNVVKYGALSRFSSNPTLRVNDFWITYTSDARVNQFYSDISLLNTDGSETLRKTIFVNEPLQINGLTIYQTDWDLIGLKLSINKSEDIQLALQKIVKSGSKFWLGSVQLNTTPAQSLTILCNNLQDSIYVYDGQGNLIGQTKLGQGFELDSRNQMIVEDFIASTGLQFKKDPGLFLVYLAFLLLMGSVYISFFSYAQIWGLEQRQQFIFGGKSNRAVLAFQEEFKKLSIEYRR